MFFEANVRYHFEMTKSRFLQITKALGDARRLEIFQRIAADGGEISCIDLRARIPLARATISHHVKELATAGLIDRRRRSKFMYLRVRLENWNEYLKYLSRLAP